MESYEGEEKWRKRWSADDDEEEDNGGKMRRVSENYMESLPEHIKGAETVGQFQSYINTHLF